MPAEVFNPNPIVFSTAKSDSRKLELSSQSLWLDDPSSSESESDQADPIDQHEIFGAPNLYFHPAHLL